MQIFLAKDKYFFGGNVKYIPLGKLFNSQVLWGVYDAMKQDIEKTVKED